MVIEKKKLHGKTFSFLHRTIIIDSYVHRTNSVRILRICGMNQQFSTCVLISVLLVQYIFSNILCNPIKKVKINQDYKKSL